MANPKFEVFEDNAGDFRWRLIASNGELLERYLATVVLGSKLDAMPESDRAGFVTEVRLAMDEPVVDYLRLVTMPALAEALRSAYLDSSAVTYQGESIDNTLNRCRFLMPASSPPPSRVSRSLRPARPPWPRQRAPMTTSSPRA